jgi:alanyl-tRNA synthetase
LIADLKSKGKSKIEGADVFELYDTYGFPIDLTSLIAKEHQIQIDSNGFKIALENQKNRSRNASIIQAEDWIQVHSDEPCEFIGYDHLEAEVKILKYRKISQKGKSFFSNRL